MVGWGVGNITGWCRGRGVHDLLHRNCLGIRDRRHEWVNPCDQEHARRHHRGSMNQRTHRGGTLHRIREPGVQRKLAGFADRPEKDQEGDGRGSRHAGVGDRSKQFPNRPGLEATGTVIVK